MWNFIFCFIKNAENEKDQLYNGAKHLTLHIYSPELLLLLQQFQRKYYENKNTE